MTITAIVDCMIVASDAVVKLRDAERDRRIAVHGDERERLTAFELSDWPDVVRDMDAKQLKGVAALEAFAKRAGLVRKPGSGIGAFFYGGDDGPIRYRYQTSFES